MARRHDLVVARVGSSLACPLDLHALVPVTDTVLRLGPDDPASLSWLWENWGTTQALRHVAMQAAATGTDNQNRLPPGMAAFLPMIAEQEPDRDIRCRTALASTLLAGLELARDGVLALEQEAAWMPILVSRRDDHDASPIETAGLAGSAPPV